MYLSRSSITQSDWRAGEPLTSTALTKVALYYVVAPKVLKIQVKKLEYPSSVDDFEGEKRLHGV